MSSSNLLRSGIRVRIRRSDGRTHTAIVSSVNDDSRTVTVEWFERGEIKGKEVGFDTIFNLNSSLTLEKLQKKDSSKPKSGRVRPPTITRSRLMTRDSSQLKQSVNEVVNEMEKLKKDREERLKQGEQRKRETMSNLDPFQQFLTMIREYQTSLDLKQ